MTKENQMKVSDLIACNFSSISDRAYQSVILNGLITYVKYVCPAAHQRATARAPHLFALAVEMSLQIFIMYMPYSYSFNQLEFTNSPHCLRMSKNAPNTHLR